MSRDRTASAEWDDLSAHTTKREVINIPVAAIRRAGRAVMCSLGAALVIVLAARWLWS